MKKASNTALAQARALIGHHNMVSELRGDSSRDAHLRVDADETNMLALQLEQMRARVYEEKFNILKARTFLPVATDVDTGAESFAYERTNFRGEAKIISNYADDLPAVDTNAEKIVHSILAIGDSYHYSIQDIRRAAFSGKPLSSRKAVAARRLWERKLDEIAATGASTAGIPNGAINSGDVAITALVNAGTWATKVGAGNIQQVLDDLNALAKSVVVDSKENFMADTLLLPLDQYILISQTRFSVDNSETILEAFLRANPMVSSVEPWNVLADAGTLVGSSDDRALLYMKSPEVLELVIPQEFEVLPPQPKNLAFNVLCHGRTAGTCIYEPLAMKYMDGI